MKRHWTLVACAVMAAISFAGCARFQPQPISSAKSAEEFENRSLSDPELRQFIATNLGSESADYDLTNLVLAAFFFHPDMDVARAKWAGLRAAQSTAAERPNPTLSIGAGYNSSVSIPSPWLVSPAVDIPIETAGKRGYRIAQASQLSEAARLNLATAAWGVGSRVRQRFVDLYAAAESESLLKEQHALQSQSLRIVEAQFEAGAISSYELTQARIGAENIRFLLRDAERLRAESRVLLADAIGIPVRALDEIKVSFTGLETLPSEIPAGEVRREALLHRSDILAGLSEYAASQSALQLEIAKQYPDIHLSPGYEFDQGDNKWTLGLGVTLPILNRNQGAIAEAKAKRAEAAANFAALQARAIGEIERAAASYQAALQKAMDADSLRESLSKQEKSLRAMLETGELSRSDVIGVQLQLSASALTRLDAIAKAQQARGMLEDALQRPTGLAASNWETAPRASAKAVTYP